MKTPFTLLEIKHETIFDTIVGIFHDFCFVDSEPIADYMWMFEPLKDPHEFADAVTSDGMAFTFMPELAEPIEELERNGGDGVIVVTKNNKPWTTIIISKLEW